MNYVITRQIKDSRSFLNPTVNSLGVELVFNLQKAHIFPSTSEATDFLYSTTLFDKGYIALPVKVIDGKVKLIEE